MRSPIRCGNRAPIAGQSLCDSTLTGDRVKTGVFRVAEGRGRLVWGGEGQLLWQSGLPCLCASMAASGQKPSLVHSQK